MDEFYTERIDRYLRGEMSREERLLFEQEALNTPELRKEIELSYLIKRSLIDRKNKLHITSQWEKKKRNRVINFAMISSIAAVLVVGFLFLRPSGDTVISVNNDFVSSVEDDNQEQFSVTSRQAVAQVKKSISEGKEEEAVATINQLESGKIIPTVGNISEMNLMSHTKGTDDKSTFAQDVYELHWIKICSLIKIGRKDEAKKALDSFVLLEGIYQEKADSLLKILKNE